MMRFSRFLGSRLVGSDKEDAMIHNHWVWRHVRTGCGFLIIIIMTGFFSSCMRCIVPVRRVGILFGSDAMETAIQAFKTRMVELGFIEGKKHRI